MKHLLYLCILLLASQTIFTEAFSKSTRPIKHTYRLIHNNDGSDLLGNIWFNRRPLTLADLDSCVDLVTKNTPVTTYMICTGSDFFYVPSKYGHIMQKSQMNLFIPKEINSLQLFHHERDFFKCVTFLFSISKDENQMPTRFDILNTCTLKIDINIDICRQRLCRISFSITSSIATIVPSAGAITSPSES